MGSRAAARGGSRARRGPRSFDRSADPVVADTGSGTVDGSDESDGTDSRDGLTGSDGPHDPGGTPARPPGDPEALARSICLRQLERRARSRVELADALARKDIPDDVAARVLDRFTEVGLIDDAALANSMAEAQHRERGLARRAVALKLRRLGIDDDTADVALAGIDLESERARARALVARRAPALERFAPEVRARRLVGLLARKGYSPAMAYEVVREVTGELDAG